MHKNLILMNQLRVNSRERLTNISKVTGIPATTLYDILRNMQGNVIRKYTVILDFEKLGYHTRAKIFLKVDPKQKDKLLNHLKLTENVNNIFKVNNGWNLLVETVHKNNRELDRYLEKLTDSYGVEKFEIHYIIDDLQREAFVVNDP